MRSPHLPPSIPVTVDRPRLQPIVRDGGVPGVVDPARRKAFGEIAVEPDDRMRAGAAVPDVKVARAAAEAGIDGLAFFRGIPGSIGGALRMNAGAHGGETTDVLVEARGVDRGGAVRTSSATPRWASPTGIRRRRDDVIFTEALFRAAPATAPRSWPRWTASRRRARRRSRSARRPAARPSRTRPATRPGS